jgi:hypothetical protein
MNIDDKYLSMALNDVIIDVRNNKPEEPPDFDADTHFALDFNDSNSSEDL